MTEEQMNLARRLVACKRWRWMPGMCVAYRQIGRDGAVKPRQSGDPAFRKLRGTLWCCEEGGYATTSMRDKQIARSIRLGPDLTDPATLGCIVALVREAWGDPFACSGQEWVDGIGDTNRWSLYLSGVEFNGDTEAAALLAALEAAP
jgi:hypothetical protein